MSEENVEHVRRAYDAFNRRDLSAYLRTQDADIEFVPYEVAVQGGEPYRGHAGIRRWWEETLEVLPDVKAEIFETRTRGDWVVVRGRLWGRGAGSGAMFDRTMWMAIEVRGGKTMWWAVFDTKAEALEAAGLSE
jgi:ketosteroid isomerase-like protein